MPIFSSETELPFRIILHREVIHKAYVFGWLFLRAPQSVPKMLNVHICLVQRRFTCVFIVYSRACVFANPISSD